MGFKADFIPSGLDGAGFQNVVASDPFNSGTVLSGCDVGGVLRSVNYGVTWKSANYGIKGHGSTDRRVASLVFSSAMPGTVYAACGAQGSRRSRSGGFYRSTDGGIQWQLLSEVPQYAGDNIYTAPLPVPHPRSTGTLIIEDAINEVIYTATFRDGLMRSFDGGYTWDTLGLDGNYLRGMALSPDGKELYVCSYNDGTWLFLQPASCSYELLPIGNDKANIEELAFIGDVLYAVGAMDGRGVIFQVLSHGRHWIKKYETYGSTVFLSISGFETQSGRTLYVGALYPKQNENGLYECLLKSTDDGCHFEPITVDAEHIHFTMGGPDGEVWWLSKRNRHAMLGGRSFVAADISIDVNDHQRLYVSGRSGVWTSPNAGIDWYPAVRNMNVTISQVLCADPNTPGRVYIGNTDWVFLFSQDHLAHIDQNKPGGDTGYGIALDTSMSPSGVYEAVASRDYNEQGDVFFCPDPVTMSWCSTGLAKATGEKRPLGLTLLREPRQPGERMTILLTCVEQAGIWKYCDGKWRCVCKEAMSHRQTQRVNTPPSTFASLPDQGLVCLFDREEGRLWCSIDYGETWRIIWDKKPLFTPTTYLALNPGKHGDLWISAVDGLYRIQDIRDGSVQDGSLQPELYPSIRQPGPLMFRDERSLIVTSGDSARQFARIFIIDPQSDSVIEMGDEYYLANAGSPSGLAVIDDHIYVSTFGSGILVGTIRQEDSL